MSTLQSSPPASGEGPVPAGRALARCVPDPAGFASVWGRAALHASAEELPRAFDDLLDLDAVDELLSRRGLRTPFLRLAKDGVVVPAGRFTQSGGVGAAIADQVDDAAVARFFAEGTTIVLQALHRMWPPVIAFAGELREDLGHPVQVNAYVTPASSRGFAAHYDVHDVFVLQIAGEKRWIVHEPAFEAPLRSQPWTERRADVERVVAEEASVLDVVLRPGDSLYLPRGFIHAAEALGDVSAHLTVGIHAVTRYTLVEALAALAAEEPELRRSLPLGLDLDRDGGLAPELEATIAALVAYAETADLDAVGDRVRGLLSSSSRPAPVAPLAQAAAAGSVAADTRVRLRSGLAARVEATDGPARLVLPDRTLELDRACVDAAALLMTGEPRVASILPGDPEAVRELIRMLLRESVVVPVAD